MNNIISKLKRLTFFDKILLTIVVFGLFLFAYIFFRKSSTISVVIRVGTEDVQQELKGTRPWFTQMYHEGMKERDGFGLTRAEITKINSYDLSFDQANVYPTMKKVLYLTLNLSTVYNRSSGQNTFKGFPVVVGSPIKLYLDGLLVDGLIVKIPGTNQPTTKHTLTVEAVVKRESEVFPETSGIDEYVARAFHTNDSVNDALGNTIISIKNVRVEQAKKIVTTADGRLLVQRDPLKKDIFLTLNIQATRLNNHYYIFDDIPILIGSKIPLNLSFVSATADVTDIIVNDENQPKP